MESRNPTLGKNTFSQFSGYPLAGRMTVNGTLNKSMLLAAVTFITGALSWAMIGSNPAVGMTLLAGGGLAGFVIALITIFKPEYSPITAPLYAICEGAALGAISYIYAMAFQGIVPQAIGLTVAIMVLMLVLYRAGILRATPMFTRIVILATLGIAVTYLVDIVLMFAFHAQLPFIDTPTPIGIGIQLVIVGVAAMNFILDFDFIEKGAMGGAPKFMEWYGAFSICVTLFWLYLEVLRMLSLLNSRR